jgi:Domain of unknown function (DUF397)
MDRSDELRDLASMTWRKTSYSGDNGGGCVEVASRVPGVVAVRDSKDPDGPRVFLAPEDWLLFTEQIKTGELDLA